MLATHLPAEAGVWRERAWPTSVEFQAIGLERIDAWGRALVDALAGSKRIQVPGKLEILRPGETPPDRRGVEPHRIRGFFDRLRRGG